jgi:hypothetical protein
VRVIASLALAACLTLAGTRGVHRVLANDPTCWVSGDLVGDSNPIDILHELCSLSVGDQIAVLG